MQPAFFYRQLFILITAVAVLASLSGMIFVRQASAGDIFDDVGPSLELRVTESSAPASGGSWQGLVPCGNPGQPLCQPCHIIVLMIGLMNFAMKTIVPAAFVLMFLYAGILMFISMGSPETWSRVKKIIWNTILGTLIIFGGYFIVDTLIKALTGDLNANGFRNLGPWNVPKILNSCGTFNAQPAPSGDFNRGTQQAASLVNTIANVFALTVLGISVIMVLYSAYLFITASGDSEQISKARKALLWALVGIAIALVAFSVPSFISSVISS